MRVVEISNVVKLSHYVRDVVNARGLVLHLVMRNIVVKYTNSLLGILWAILEPVCTLLIFIFVFGVLGRFGAGESATPYSLIVISGIVCWQLFSLNLVALAESLVSN